MQNFKQSAEGSGNKFVSQKMKVVTHYSCLTLFDFPNACEGNNNKKKDARERERDSIS
jgi:hypothetical protein